MSTGVHIIGLTKKLEYQNYKIRIHQIVCGDSHTHILSKDGLVYSFGSNTDGILGLGQNI